MRPLQCQPINNQASSSNITTSPIDFRQIVNFSAQLSASTGACAGTLQLQVSNTPCLQKFLDYGNSANPVTWTNLGSPLTFSQASTASSQLISKTDNAYVALRGVWSSVPGAVTTITTIPDSSGSLNNTYFFFSSNTTAYYVWFNINSAGTDPALFGRTGIQIAAATNATANTLAGLLRTNLAVTGVATSGATNQCICTGANASDSSGAPTGFTFGTTNNNTSNITLNLSGLGL
jgi:hypothetical protein